ncbi:MAG: hypothetical protein GWP37_04240 [Gammaproteobacteria bacterium]|nr:hypothetical protein [Luminiphilus sp.]NCG06159.1 hypothetical protein [Gammaproteobacteria bacterium]
MTHSAVIAPRTLFLVSLMVMAIISERGLASTFRKPLIRPAVPPFPIVVQQR